MLRRIFLTCLAGSLVVFSMPRSMPRMVLKTEAQGAKPSQALRQISQQQKKLLETFDADLGSQKAQPYEWEQREETLKRLAAERARDYKIADWKGDELYNLATLYQIAELFPQSVEAFRAYIASEPEAKREPNAVPSLIRALIETDQISEAGKMLEGMNWTIARSPMLALSRIALYKDLAIALRDRGYFENAAYQARKGYMLANSINQSQGVFGPLQDSSLQDQIVLATIAIASFEKVGKKNEANNLQKLIETYDFKRQPALKTRFESELVSARLVGAPAPQLVVSRWLDADGRNIADLRGKVVLVEFWALWCSPCIASYPYWREYQSRYVDQGFEVLGITRFYGRSDTDENLSREQELKSLQNYKIKYKVTWPVAIGKMDDLTNDEQYGVNAMPTIILIDRRGNVRHVKRGTGGYQKLAKQIERLLGEKT